MAVSMLDEIRRVARSTSDLPRPARIEVGYVAQLLTLALRTVWASQGSTRSTLGPLFGVPVIPSAELLPLQWRVLDADGAVLVEGEVGR